MRVTVIDNFDSFTFNLVDYFRRLECQVKVYRNDVPVAIVESSQPDLLVLSPGPSTPANAGNLMAYIDHFHRSSRHLWRVPRAPGPHRIFWWVVARLAAPVSRQTEPYRARWGWHLPRPAIAAAGGTLPLAYWRSHSRGPRGDGDLGRCRYGRPSSHSASGRRAVSSRVHPDDGKQPWLASHR